LEVFRVLRGLLDAATHFGQPLSLFSSKALLLSGARLLLPYVASGANDAANYKAVQEHANPHGRAASKSSKRGSGAQDDSRIQPICAPEMGLNAFFKLVAAVSKVVSEEQREDARRLAAMPDIALQATVIFQDLYAARGSKFLALGAMAESVLDAAGSAALTGACMGSDQLVFTVVDGDVVRTAASAPGLLAANDDMSHEAWARHFWVQEFNAQNRSACFTFDKVKVRVHSVKDGADVVSLFALGGLALLHEFAEKPNTKVRGAEGRERNLRLQLRITEIEETACALVLADDDNARDEGFTVEEVRVVLLAWTPLMWAAAAGMFAAYRVRHPPPLRGNGQGGIGVGGSGQGGSGEGGSGEGGSGEGGSGEGGSGQGGSGEGGADENAPPNGRAPPVRGRRKLNLADPSRTGIRTNVYVHFAAMCDALSKSLDKIAGTRGLRMGLRNASIEEANAERGATSAVAQVATAPAQTIEQVMLAMLDRHV